MNIYIIGFMGSGKSTAGRKIAAALRWNFIDLDKAVTEKEKLSVAEIFDRYGECYFRESEKTALQEVSEKTKTVVACGGGTPCSDENMSLMRRTGVILYLMMPAEALAARLLRSKTYRPLLAGAGDTEMLTRVKELLEKRRQWYDQADLVADGVNTDIDLITGQLADYIRAAGAFL